MSFVARFPAATRNGVPISWAHYVAGLACIRQERAARKLDIESAMRIAQSTDGDVRRQWRDLHAIASGEN
jgi:hypothetical protein